MGSFFILTDGEMISGPWDWGIGDRSSAESSWAQLVTALFRAATSKCRDFCQDFWISAQRYMKIIQSHKSHMRYLNHPQSQCLNVLSLPATSRATWRPPEGADFTRLLEAKHDACHTSCSAPFQPTLPWCPIHRLPMSSARPSPSEGMLQAVADLSNVLFRRRITGSEKVWP